MLNVGCWMNKTVLAPPRPHKEIVKIPLPKGDCDEWIAKDSDRLRLPVGRRHSRVKDVRMRRGANLVCSAVAEWWCYASPDREGLASYLLDIYI